MDFHVLLCVLAAPIAFKKEWSDILGNSAGSTRKRSIPKQVGVKCRAMLTVNYSCALKGNAKNHSYNFYVTLSNDSRNSCVIQIFDWISMLNI